MVELGDSKREAGPEFVISDLARIGRMNRAAERGSKTVSDCGEYYKTYAVVLCLHRWCRLR